MLGTPMQSERTSQSDADTQDFESPEQQGVESVTTDSSHYQSGAVGDGSDAGVEVEMPDDSFMVRHQDDVATSSSHAQASATAHQPSLAQHSDGVVAELTEEEVGHLTEKPHLSISTGSEMNDEFEEQYENFVQKAIDEAFHSPSPWWTTKTLGTYIASGGAIMSLVTAPYGLTWLTLLSGMTFTLGGYLYYALKHLEVHRQNERCKKEILEFERVRPTLHSAHEQINNTGLLEKYGFRSNSLALAVNLLAQGGLIAYQASSEKIDLADDSDISVGMDTGCEQKGYPVGPVVIGVASIAAMTLSNVLCAHNLRRQNRCFNAIRDVQGKNKDKDESRLSEEQQVGDLQGTLSLHES